MLCIGHWSRLIAKLLLLVDVAAPAARGLTASQPAAASLPTVRRWARTGKWTRTIQVSRGRTTSSIGTSMSFSRVPSHWQSRCAVHPLPATGRPPAPCLSVVQLLAAGAGVTRSTGCCLFHACLPIARHLHPPLVSCRPLQRCQQRAPWLPQGRQRNISYRYMTQSWLVDLFLDCDHAGMLSWVRVWGAVYGVVSLRHSSMFVCGADSLRQCCVSTLVPTTIGPEPSLCAATVGRRAFLSSLTGLAWLLCRQAAVTPPSAHPRCTAPTRAPSLA